MLVSASGHRCVGLDLDMCATEHMCNNASFKVEGIGLHSRIPPVQPLRHSYDLPLLLLCCSASRQQPVPASITT